MEESLRRRVPSIPELPIMQPGPISPSMPAVHRPLRKCVGPRLDSRVTGVRCDRIELHFQQLNEPFLVADGRHSSRFLSQERE